MAGLLVSVRDEPEAIAAWQGGAAVVDVKEPRRGSLGAASSEVWEQVARTLAGRVPLSVALGELTDRDLPGRLDRLPPVDFAKIGLAGCRRLPDWDARWQQAVSRLPAQTAPVAVAYVDWRPACAPPPHEVQRRAREMGCRVMLWDTYRKRAGGLLQWMETEPLARSVEQARQEGLLAVLAGSLTVSDLTAVLPLAPDLIAVRGAVCVGSRTGRVAGERVRQFVAALAGEAYRNSRDGLPTQLGGADYKAS